MVHARYCGPLKRGEYPFKFSGGNFKTCEEYVEKYKDFNGSTTGFLMPHSGRIKKVIFEGLGFVEGNVAFEKLVEGEGEEMYKNFKKLFEEFKKNHEKKRLIDFSPIGKEEKFYLNIVKFEKNLNEEDCPQPNYNPPKIISSVLIDKFKVMGISFVDGVFNIELILRIIHQGDGALSEGDVINIMPVKDIPGSILDSYIKRNSPFIFPGEYLRSKLLEIMLKWVSYNFTFLIELDPL